MSARLIMPGQMLQDGAEKLGVVLLEEQSQALREFALLLANFNEHTNLVANCEPDVLLRDHILDSLSLISPMKKCAKKMKIIGRGHRLIDIGTGGGFPGLILAIADPALKVALVESVAKKTRFLSEAITALALSERVTVHNSRAESLAHDKEYGHQFDFATCRAVGSLPTVLELTLPFLRRSGVALIQRSGAQARQEAVPVAKAVGKLGARLDETIYLDEAVLGKERAVFIFEQKALSGRPYPRPWPKPKDSPLF